MIFLVRIRCFETQAHRARDPRRATAGTGLCLRVTFSGDTKVERSGAYRVGACDPDGGRGGGIAIVDRDSGVFVWCCMGTVDGWHVKLNAQVAKLGGSDVHGHRLQKVVVLSKDGFDKPV